MAEFSIDARTVSRVASVLVLDFFNQRRVLNREKAVVPQSELIEGMTLQCFIIGVAESVLQHTLKLQQSDRATGSSGRSYEISAQ